MSLDDELKAIAKIPTQQQQQTKNSDLSVFRDYRGTEDAPIVNIFGTNRRSRSELRSHRLVIGDTGSGKNLVTDPYIAHTLVNRKPDDLHVFFDPKGSIVQMLKALGIKYHIVSIDDERGLGLDITKDCASIKDRYELMKAMKSGSGGVQDFWENIGLAATIGVANSMFEIGYYAPLLATLIRVLQMPPQVRKVEILPDGTEQETPELEDFLITFLKHSKDNARLIQVLESGESIKTGLLAEVLATLQKLIPAGSHDARVKQRISLREFVKRECVVEGEPVRVLVFNMDIRARKASEAYFRLAFRMLVNSVLALPDVVNDPNHSKIFVTIDEYAFVSSSGLPEIQSLAAVGRSKGLHLLLVLQSVNQMYDCHGKEEGEAILGSLPDIIFTATSSATNAEFASNKAGEVYVQKTKISSSEGDRGINYTTTQTDDLQHVFPTGKLLSLPFPTKAQGLYFYQIDSDAKHEGAPIYGHWSGELVNELKPPLDKSVPGFIPRDPSYYYMPPLSEVERKHLVTGVSPLFDAMVENIPAPFGNDESLGAELAGDIADVVITEAEAGNENARAIYTAAIELLLDEYQSGLDRYMQATYGTSGR